MPIASTAIITNWLVFLCLGTTKCLCISNVYLEHTDTHIQTHTNTHTLTHSHTHTGEFLDSSSLELLRMPFGVQLIFLFLFPHHRSRFPPKYICLLKYNVEQVLSLTDTHTPHTHTLSLLLSLSLSLSHVYLLTRIICEFIPCPKKMSS